MNVTNKFDVKKLSQRTPDKEIRAEKSHIEKHLVNESLKKILDSVPDFIIILDANRQALFANESFRRFLNIKDFSAIIGKRPGEILNCIHASQSKCGCGTTQFCKYCGAVQAILMAQRGKKAQNECRLYTTKGEAYDLVISSSPINVGKKLFTVFIAGNISDEKRRQALERIFFHDILNTVNVIWNLSSLLRDDLTQNTPYFSEKISETTKRLMDEIQSQRMLLYAENKELQTSLTKISARKFINEIKSAYEKISIAKGKKIILNDGSPDIIFSSDISILERVVGNMLKNALEASKTGDQVNIGYKKERHNISFWVKNPAFIPKDIQLQIFNRSFTTKEIGRGLGTYSIKLLTENYLNGKVHFKSTPKSGTTFFVSYPIK